VTELVRLGALSPAILDGIFRARVPLEGHGGLSGDEHARIQVEVEDRMSALLDGLFAMGPIRTAGSSRESKIGSGSSSDHEERSISDLSLGLQACYSQPCEGGIKVNTINPT
jgi:hypothetical protein